MDVHDDVLLQWGVNYMHIMYRHTYAHDIWLTEILVTNLVTWCIIRLDAVLLCMCVWGVYVCNYYTTLGIWLILYLHTLVVLFLYTCNALILLPPWIINIVFMIELYYVGGGKGGGAVWRCRIQKSLLRIITSGRYRRWSW